MQLDETQGMDNPVDQPAFITGATRYQRELQAHCYRMLGSLQDAEDMVQETFYRAWRRRETYRGQASLRAWLYKIATNACLDALEKRARRVIPRTYQPESTMDEPIPGDVNEPIWLEPYPDEWLTDATITAEDAVVVREQITLAFITALHLLPPRQRAVLLLRDVLDWQAREVADLLDMTVPAVKSALHRARATLSAYDRTTPAPAHLDVLAQERLWRYVQAWEMADIPAFLALLKEDATFSMPPIPAWYRGRDTIQRLVGATIFRGEAQGRWTLRPTRANGQVAFGLYRQSGETYTAYGIQVLTLVDDAIADIITFRVPGLFSRFHLPLTLADEMR